MLVHPDGRRFAAPDARGDHDANGHQDVCGRRRAGGRPVERGDGAILLRAGLHVLWWGLSAGPAAAPLQALAAGATTGTTATVTPTGEPIEIHNETVRQ